MDYVRRDQVLSQEYEPELVVVGCGGWRGDCIVRTIGANKGDRKSQPVVVGTDSTEQLCRLQGNAHTHVPESLYTVGLLWPVSHTPIPEETCGRSLMWFRQLYSDTSSTLRHSLQQSHNKGLYILWIQRCHTFSFGHYHQAPGASCSILYILVLSLVIFMQFLYITFLIYKIFHLLVSFHFLLVLAVRLIERNNFLVWSLSSSAWCIMQYTVYPCLVSCHFYAIPI